MNMVSYKKNRRLENVERTRQDKMTKIMHCRQWWREAEVKERQVRHSNREGESHRIYREWSQRMSRMRERQKDKDREEEQQKASHTFALPDLLSYWAKSRLVGRLLWCSPCLFCNLSKGVTFFCVSLCVGKGGSLRGQHLNHCSSLDRSFKPWPKTQTYCFLFH